MTKLRTIVVDDEPLARKLLVSMLAEAAGIEIIGECCNGREAVSSVLELTPDLMFLDISMPGLNGFEVIKKIQPELLPLVIFCTAFERYALDAFDVHAVDYIVKPMDEERVHLAVKRAVARAQASRQDGNEKSILLGAIDAITSNVAERVSMRDRAQSGAASPDMERKIAIKDNDSIKLIKETKIGWVDAAGDYMCVHAEGETHIMRCTMKHLLEELDGSLFKRVHRSTIVNLNCIDQVIPQPKGEYVLQLENGERIKVSRNYREAIRSFLSATQK